MFMFGTWLAGFAGALVASLVVLALHGREHHHRDLLVVVIGGLGSFAGSFISAVLVGQLQSFGILIWSAISLPLVFPLMAVVLIVRPWGLLGRPEHHRGAAGGAIRPTRGRDARP